jgi:hypothetical protein
MKTQLTQIQIAQTAFYLSVRKWGVNNNEIAIISKIDGEIEIEYDLMGDVWGTPDVLTGRTDMQVYGAIREIEQALSPNF